MDCLKYAHENGCGWSFETIKVAANNNHLECLRYAYENGCSMKDCKRRMDCLKYLVEIVKLPMNPQLVTFAISVGKVFA